MDKTRITAAIWPWGTQNPEQMETAAKEITEIGYTSFESVKAVRFEYAYKDKCVAERDYEKLEMYVLELLMGV